MKNILCPILILLVCACQPPSQKKQAEKKPEVSPDIRISCEGIGKVKLTDTYTTLEKKFGAKALSWHENNVSGRFLSIWNDDAKQINVYWKEKTAPFKHIRSIETVSPNAPYMTNDSLRIGLSLHDVVRRNGFMPLTFNNFYNEKDDGLIISFNNGDLPKSNPCLEGKLEWVSQTNIYKKDYNDFKKKKVVESSDPILEHMEVMLGTLRVSAKQ